MNNYPQQVIAENVLEDDYPQKQAYHTDNDETYKLL